jgi:hypothetical protein
MIVCLNMLVYIAVGVLCSDGNKGCGIFSTKQNVIEKCDLLKSNMNHNKRIIFFDGTFMVPLSFKQCEEKDQYREI